MVEPDKYLLADYLTLDIRDIETVEVKTESIPALGHRLEYYEVTDKDGKIYRVDEFELSMYLDEQREA